MKSIKAMIPLKVKSPTAVFVREVGKMPITLVFDHVLRTYTEESGALPKTCLQALQARIRRNTYRYFDKKYGLTAADLVQEYNSGEKTATARIWVFWWQGETQAPDIVKKCIHAIRKNSNGASVQMIDATNYRQFVTVPVHIEAKRESGTLSLTHFSDYYRMALLAAHGGLWIDASIFVKSLIPTAMFYAPIFTVRNPTNAIDNISNWEWTVGIIGGQKGNSLFVAAAELLSKYWEEHNCLVDYYMFDYVLRLIYEHSEDARKAIEAIPASNPDMYFLQDHLNDSAEEFYWQLEKQNTIFYKVSWKGIYSDTTVCGKDTVYTQWNRETATSERR